MLFDVDEDVVLIGGGCVDVAACTCVDDVVIGSTVVEDVLAKAVVDVVTGSDAHGMSGVLHL